MDTEHTRIENEHTAAVSEIARTAEAGELTRERLGEILSGRYGAVNCYPGQPMPACHPTAYFVALEGRMGRKIQIELAQEEWEGDHPWQWWPHHQWRFGDFPAAREAAPPFTFAYMLERLVRHLQGNCAGTTRQAVLITDTWDAPAFERWRANLETIRKTAHLEIHLIGAGHLSTRLV